MSCRFSFLIHFLQAVAACFFSTNAAAQTVAALPNPDSLSVSEVLAWAVQLSNQAKDFETAFSQKALVAAVVRESAEQSLKTAKQDTLTPKSTLDSLASNVKTAKNIEKTAQKNQKQASQTSAFATKVVSMDSVGQRKNLRKAWKQVKELEALLHPPAEKPIADVIGSQGVSDSSPADSAAAAQPAADNRKIKEKKPEKALPKHKPYDPAADVMRNPPQRPCTLALSTRDEFSGQTYRETQREELFRYTNEVMKKVLPPGESHIVCEAALSNGGISSSLHLTFNIRDANARKAFGSLTKNSIAVLKFLDGTTFTLNNLRNDDGARDDSGQVFVYRAQYPLDAAVLKKLRKNELDKIRVAWGTGYEDYEVQGVDVLMRQVKCLGE
jgi:hypothetical protein